MEQHDIVLTKPHKCFLSFNMRIDYTGLNHESTFAHDDEPLLSTSATTRLCMATCIGNSFIVSSVGEHKAVLRSRFCSP